jgi:hypothetical protein
MAEVTPVTMDHNSFKAIARALIKSLIPEVMI